MLREGCLAKRSPRHVRRPRGMTSATLLAQCPARGGKRRGGHRGKKKRQGRHHTKETPHVGQGMADWARPHVPFCTTAHWYRRDSAKPFARRSGRRQPDSSSRTPTLSSSRIPHSREHRDPLLRLTKWRASATIFRTFQDFHMIQ